MQKINQPTAKFIDKILGVIFLEKGLSRNTKIAYTKDINLFFEWYRNKKINFLYANEKHFLEFFSYLQRKNYKPSSLNRKLSSLKQFYLVCSL